jgi:hypothetical protein
VGTGLGAAPEESALSRAARMPRIGDCGPGPDQLRAIADGEVLQERNYYKYWAGYTVITRPVLALTGIEGLRIVSGTLMVAGLVGAFLAVRARTSTAVSVALLLPFVAGTNLLSTPSTSLSHSIAIAFIFLSVALTALGAGRSTRLGCAGAALGAALFCYVDLLTTPSIPWAMSSFVLGAAVWSRRRELAATFVAALLGGLVWPVAFGITWVSRWVFGAAFMGVSETLDLVRENVGFRMGGDHAAVSEALGAGLRINVRYWWDVVPTSGLVLAGCLLVAAVGLVLALLRGGPSRWAVAVVLSLSAIAVPVWYEALSNHSQIHALFTNRAVPAALAIVTAACLAAAVRPRPVPDEQPPPEDGRRSLSGIDEPAEAAGPVGRRST